MAVADQVACIPLVYGRSTAYVKPRVKGWWEFGKTSANFADLGMDPGAESTEGVESTGGVERAEGEAPPRRT